MLIASNAYLVDQGLVSMGHIDPQALNLQMESVGFQA